MSRDSTRIWRTVVFSGAMLGAPLVIADTPKDKPAAPQQAKPKPPPPTPLEVAQADLESINKKIDVAITAVKDAQNDADRKAATAKLESLRREKVAFEAKITNLKQAKPSYYDQTAVSALEKQLQEIDSRVTKAVDGVANAQNDADRKAATAKLTSVRRERDDVKAKLVAEKAKPVKRPRTPDSDKPVGRGFVLS